MTQAKGSGSEGSDQPANPSDAQRNLSPGDGMGREGDVENESQDRYALAQASPA